VLYTVLADSLGTKDVLINEASDKMINGLELAKVLGIADNRPPGKLGCEHDFTPVLDRDAV
jgi:hypothetical protein